MTCALLCNPQFNDLKWIVPLRCSRWISSFVSWWWRFSIRQLSDRMRRRLKSNPFVLLKHGKAPTMSSVQNRSADSAAAESSLLTVWSQEVTQVQTEHKPEDKDSQNLCLKGETGPSTLKLFWLRIKTAVWNQGSFNVTSFLEVLWRDSSPSVLGPFLWTCRTVC